LFWRSTRGVELTESGRTFLHEAERVAGDLLNLSEAARRLRGGGSETLNLAIVSGAAQSFVPRFFAEVSKTIQDVKLRIKIQPTRRIFEELHEERIDAGIAIESDPDRVPAGLVFDRIAAIEMALILHPKHPLAKSRSPINVSAFAAEPIVMNELEIGYGQIVLSLFADLGLRPNILAVADNVETIKIIVQTGAGIAILPRSCVEHEVSVRLLKAMTILPQCNVAFGLFRRREPLSRHKEACLSAINRALQDNTRMGRA
jgi:DNA-binding transcriptional LysR family regulator